MQFMGVEFNCCPLCKGSATVKNDFSKDLQTENLIVFCLTCQLSMRSNEFHCSVDPIPFYTELAIRWNMLFSLGIPVVRKEMANMENIPISYPVALRINHYDDRGNVVKALVEAGYTVRIEVYTQVENFNFQIDTFVVIVECPELPAYKKQVA